MVEQDNSIPFTTIDKNPKPAKVRKFKTLLLHGFDGNTDHQIITRVKNGSSGKIIDIPVKINLG